MLEDVSLLRHVERLREARVRDRAVVALEEVLGADLPVARVLVALGARVEAEPVDLDAAVREQPGEPTEGARERPGVAIRVDEHERAPGLGGDGDERQRLAVEGSLALGPGRVPQRAVEVVCPRVVRALDRLALRVRLAEHMASVPADVHERAELAVAAADDEDGSEPAHAGVMLPGSATRSARVAYCHERAKMRSCSTRSTAGSAYQAVTP